MVDHLFRITIRNIDLSMRKLEGIVLSMPRTRAAATRARVEKPARSPRARAREAREEVYREHVLAAAEQTFAEQGFEAAKLLDISRRAGLSMGSIYTLFPGKEQIYEAITERHATELLALVRSIVARDEGPLATLEALAAAYIDYFHAHPDFLRMHVRTGTAWALATQTPGDRGELAREIHRLQTSIFSRGVAEGVFFDEDPSYLGFLFTGMDEIHLAQWVAGGMREPREELLARFLKIVRRTFVRS
jgi:AcrR family transcriptional regulator